MAAISTQWRLKTAEEEYLEGLEQKLSKVRATSLAPNGDGVNGISRKQSGFLTAELDGDDDISSLRESEGASTVMGADDEAEEHEEDDSSDDDTKEGKALLDDIGEQVPRLDKDTAEQLEATVRVASPVDFSRGTIVRPALVRHGISEAFQLSFSPIAGPSSHSDVANGSLQADNSRFSSSGSEGSDLSDTETPTAQDVVLAGVTLDKRSSVKFHDTVRISGGIKRQKRRRKRRPANALPKEAYPHAPHAPRAPSPLRDLFSDLRPTPPPPHRPPPVNTGYFDAHGVPSGSGSHTPSGRITSGNMSSSPALAAHPHIFANRSRRPSSTMSFRDGYGSGYGSGFASVLTSATQSRSSSPASSIYAPLRMPAVRAPAPFFGPTPERLTRMREKKEAARREAERAKGGWRSWWFGEAKAKAPAAEDDDEENAPCYHDVIIEHERSRRQRKLGKAPAHLQVPDHHPRPHEEHDEAAGQSKESTPWFWQFWRRRPTATDEENQPHPHHHHHHHHHHHPHSHGSHLHPIHGPLPSPAPRGRPLHRSRSALLGSINPSLPDVSEDEVVDPNGTPKLSNGKALPSLENGGASTSEGHPAPATAQTPLLDPASRPSSRSRSWFRRRRRRSKPKTEVYVRFGPAPRRWFKAAWWRWRWRLIRRWFAERVEAWKETWNKWQEEDWEEGDGGWQQI